MANAQDAESCVLQGPEEKSKAGICTAIDELATACRYLKEHRVTLEQRKKELELDIAAVEEAITDTDRLLEEAEDALSEVDDARQTIEQYVRRVMCKTKGSQS